MNDKAEADDDLRELPDGSFLHDPGNKLLHIDELWAFISVDKDGNEGLCGAPLQNGMTIPMIAADQRRLTTMMPIAKQLAIISGKPIRLIKLSRRDEVLTIGIDGKKAPRE